jgi:hypothetical protein
MRLASRFGRINQIRRDRPLTHEELMSHVPSVFGSDKHESRSDRYARVFRALNNRSGIRR